jgi:bifunctional DNase/RNase
MIGLCLAAAGVTLVAGSRAGSRSPRAPGPDMQEVEVLGVRAMPDGEANMLYLGAKDASAVLPLVVGRAEATAIEIRLRAATPPRPLTHDLLGKAIETLGARVVRVEIDGLRDGTFFATIRLAQGGKALALDARPSDSVALALRTGAPIYAARKVLDDGGLRRDELEAPGGKESGEAPPKHHRSLGETQSL